jgi:hypothetical protein
MDTKDLGRWALVLGVVLALIGAFADLAFLTDYSVLAILGLVGGILYLSLDDAKGFYILGLAVVAFGGALGDFFGLGVYVADWMAGSAAVIGAAAVALIVRTFINWAMP